ncbi:hypothetical protein Hypma_000137 [Hypsizygus marmoreus]|uniref:Alpha/beta hydrolase fold-3 domain-containing protein n=1 Tax=Hypsizygus marmoreus TaxID=39966 RepID=A0A369KBK5_HYPMA|nr:hypothetical protein Hypma_000137 [Hypsizygus marmoreus]
MQLCQANAAFMHILNFHQVPSSSLLLLGDSAGGHLLLMLLSHLVHGHPALPASISLQHPLAGILLLSPSTTHRKLAPSFAENCNKDIVRPEVYECWFSAFCGPAISTPEGLEADGWWTEHLGTPKGWWTGLGTTISKRILLSAGEHECYHDDIKAFARKLVEEMKGEPMDLVFHLEKWDVHNSLCFYPPGTAPEELFELVAAWVTESLSD